MSKLPEGTVTILFTDVEGSTALHTAVGDEAARAILNAHEELVRSQVADHGGHEIKSLGDGFMVAFTSARPAVSCAVAIQRAFQEEARRHPGTGTQLRIGLNSGDVIEQGGDLLGAAVNAAARIAAKAEGGQILVSSVVRDLAGMVPDASFANRGKFRLKGFDERWQLFEVVWQKQRAAAALLERERELAAVAAVVANGGAVLVEGGAGIGKTSLLAATCTAAEAGGREILRARGSELEEGFAFGVVLQLFELLVASADDRERDRLFAGAAAAVRALLSGEVVEGGGDDVSFAVLHGLYWFAANMASVGAVVLAVDDAQWADDASLRWLAYLAARLEGLPLSLLIAVRPTERSAADPSVAALRGAASLVRPGLLSEGAVATVVRDVVGGEADDGLCAAVWRESGGNPFYLRELVRPLAASDGPPAAVDAEALLAQAGQGVTAHVAARVRSLDPRALRLAQALSVLGDGCELRHAAVIAGVEHQTAARLAAGLVRLEVLLADDPPRFLHPIVRQAVEASLGNDERDTHHRAAAALLHEDGAPPGMVAAHLLRTRPAADSWVLARLREAAQTAVESGAPQGGAQLLRRALAEPPPPAERVAVMQEAAGAEVLAGRASGCELLEEALTLEPDPRRRAEIGLALAEACASVFRWVEGVDASERALAELGDAEVDVDLATALEAGLVVCGLRDSRRAARVLSVLDRLASRHLEGGPAEAYAVARAIEGLWFAGRTATEVAVPLGEAFARAGPRPASWDTRAPGLWALAVAEGFAAAEATLDGMLKEVQRSGSARGMEVSYLLLALVKFRLGALAEADAASRVAVRVMQAGDFAPGLPLGLHVLADTLIEAGELDEAEGLLDMMPPGDLPPGLGTVHVAPARGRLLMARGRAAEALAQFERGQAMFNEAVWGMPVHDNGFLHARSWRALALLQLGERERAQALAADELAAARAFGGKRALGVSLRAAGLTEGGAAGLTLLQESASVLAGSPALLERAHSLVELGAAYRRAGRRIDAREPLAHGLDLAARCGARPLAARAREELKATGARPRREWRSGVEALTPSELRVARLAADGRTNREIAQALYITLKTVEGHLARVYGKLEITGRDALRAGLEPEKTGVATP